MKVAVVLCALAVVANAVPLEHDSEWQKFKSAFSKTYENLKEELFRRSVFRDNLKYISSHNGKHFELGVNEFADMTREEFVKTRTGEISSSVRGKYQRPPSTYMFPENENPATLPAEVDWRKHGFVTPVKNQGNCGSCWSFSTTGSLEGQHFRATGKLVSLSEQNLVDCSTLEGDHGCQGGLMPDAFSYVAINGGIMSEADYPYKAVKGNCTFDSSKVAATDTAWVAIPEFNETALKEAVATVGPVSIAIDASKASFHFYTSGVYYDADCSPTDLDHGVLVVGYGTENGADYWLVKNSWGPTWGEAGYIKMARNRKNACGVATAASYPVV